MTTAAQPRPPVRIWGYLACAWCVLFAALHVYWAAGGNAGLASSAGADLAAHRPVWFVLFGLWGVAVLLAGGAVYSLGTTRWRPSGLLRRGAVLVGWVGGGVLLVRGVLLEVALLTGFGGIRSAVGPAETHWSLVLWNPWFIAGGLVVVLAARQWGRR